MLEIEGAGFNCAASPRCGAKPTVRGPAQRDTPSHRKYCVSTSTQIEVHTQAPGGKQCCISPMRGKVKSIYGINEGVTRFIAQEYEMSNCKWKFTIGGRLVCFTGDMKHFAN